MTAVLGRTSVDWRIWRVVSAGYGTLTEIEQHWSIDDLLDAGEVLDAKAEIEAEHRAAQES